MVALQRYLVNGEIQEQHDIILKILAQFGYLNSFLLRNYLYHISGKKYDYDCSHMRRILKDMVYKGFIVQYELFHDIDGTEQGSPFLYCLSGGGIHYLKKQNIPTYHPILSKPFQIEEVLNLMVVNQFHVTFLKQYKGEPNLKFGNYFRGIYKKMNIPLMYTFFIKSIKNQSNILYIFVAAIRQSDSWEKQFLQFLTKIQENREEYECDKGIPIFLLICETEYQAMECGRIKEERGDLKNINVYYMTDTSVITEEDVFDRIISVHIMEDNKINRRICRLELRQNERKE